MKRFSTLLSRASSWFRLPGHSSRENCQVDSGPARIHPAPAPADDFSLNRFDIDQADIDRLPRYALSDQNFVVDELEMATALDRGQSI
jgi:hypothetical protein